MSYSKRGARRRQKRNLLRQRVRLGFRYKKLALRENLSFSELAKYESVEGMSIKEMMQSREKVMPVEADSGSSDFFSDFSFFDDDKKPQLKDAFCVFLDVLGFTKRLEDSYSEGNKDALFRDFVAISKAEITKIKDKDSYGVGIISRVFSDNILLAQPLFSEDCEHEFWSIINSTLEYQLEMALKGFFVRGGFVRGDLFVDEEIIYGKALLDSVKIESKLALTSRILLSEDVLEKVIEHLDFYDGKINAPQYEQVFLNKDRQDCLVGSGFLNYLTQLTTSGELDAEKLMQHRDQVIGSTMNFKDNDELAYKYYWLCQYHNYFCSTVTNYSTFKEECYIPMEIFPEIDLNTLCSKLKNIGLNEGLFQFERL